MLWWILAGIAALITLVCLTPLRLTVTMDEDCAVTVRLTAFGVCILHVPKKKRAVRLSDYTPRAIKRRQKKQQAKLRKQRKKEQKKSKSSDRTTSEPTAKQPSLLTQLGSITDLVKTIAARALHRCRVRVVRLKVTVATGDAATTALLYGAATSALAFLTEALFQFSNLTLQDEADFGVAADFVGNRTRADVKIHFHLRAWHLLDIVLSAVPALLRHQQGSKTTDTPPLP